MVIILSMQSAEDMSALESSNQSWPSWMAAATASCKATGGWLTSPLMLNGLHGSRAKFGGVGVVVVPVDLGFGACFYGYAVCGELVVDHV
jgi:hypothetical protein